jgi:hypothetical protein
MLVWQEMVSWTEMTTLGTNGVLLMFSSISVQTNAFP